MDRPKLYFKAINPGYTVDGKSNVGEFIELARSDETDTTELSLAGLIIGYTNSSGKTIDLFEFPEGSWMTGENLMLKLSSSSEDEQANILYLKTIAFSAGPLELIFDGEVIDSVCWNGKEDCYKSFKSSKPTTLVRDEETFEFEHLEEYAPKFNLENFHEPEEEEIQKQCQKLQFSELLSYYESSQSEQFIEFYNPTSEQILLDGCKIQYKNKFYDLSGVVQPDDFFVRYLSDFSLTKDPANTNTINLIDTDNEKVAELTYFNGQKKATSYAKIGYDANGEEIWKNTYNPTPGTENIYQQYKNCEEGKVINISTGNCVNITTIKENTKICDEGYELNPETNRCRKIKINNGAEYEIVTKNYEETNNSFVALYAVIIIAIISIIYVIFQFKTELKKLFRKVFRQSHQKPHHDSGCH